MKYRKKPVVIEAVQFTDDKYETTTAIQEFMETETFRISYEEPGNPKIVIETLEGTMYASVGDYIVKGVHGEFYPCKPDIFEATYEVVE